MCYFDHQVSTGLAAAPLGRSREGRRPPGTGWLGGVAHAGPTPQIDHSVPPALVKETQLDFARSSQAGALGG